MTLALNVIWVVLGGFFVSAAWFVAGALAAISVVGLPWARACLNIALFSLWPFGREAVPRQVLTGREDLGTGTLGLIGNVVWLLLLGIWLALAHLTAAVAFGLTIIGIPFAWQHVKLAGLSLMPVGKAVVNVNDLDRLAR